MSRQIDVAVKILEADEGFEQEPYYCSEKFPTIGHGFRIEGTGKFDPLPAGLCMSYNESISKLRTEIVGYDTKLQSHEQTRQAYEKANDVQKAVMLSMAHQLGFYGLLEFKKFLAAARRGDWPEAARQALDSVAARQTPNRWARNAAMIESGDIHQYYA